MKDVKLGEPVTVTLRAGEWYWLLGLIAAIDCTGAGNSTIDKVVDQVYEATQ